MFQSKEMKLTIEKSLKGKLSKFSIDSVDGIYLTHLPGNSLESVANAADQMNQRIGKPLAVPHCAARNIQSPDELQRFVEMCLQYKLHKILLIGGSVPSGPVFDSVDDILALNFIPPEIKHEVGVYPQSKHENFSTVANKLSHPTCRGGITQLCMDTSMLSMLAVTYREEIRVGIPSMCSTKGLWRYMKICGNRSVRYMLDNWRGVFYLKSGGFDVKKFTKQTGHDSFHVYDFGRMEKTIETLMSV